MRWNLNDYRLAALPGNRITPKYKSISDDDAKYAMIYFLQVLLKLDLSRKSDLFYNGPLWLFNDFSREDVYVLTGFKGYERLPW